MENEKVLKRLDEIEEMLFANSQGIQNVYNEFKHIKECVECMNKSTEEIKKESNIADHPIQLLLKISSFPLNIRIDITIMTNFGEISHIFDYPPFHEGRIQEVIKNVYFSLLNELYEEHTNKGGKFPGEDGAKEYFDKNGLTTIIKPSDLSPKIEKIINSASL